MTEVAVALDEYDAVAQRQASLDKANQARQDRARVKRGLAAREISPEEILTSPPEFASKISAYELLTWIPGIGPMRAALICREAFISQTLRMSVVSERSRQIMVRRVCHRQPDRHRAHA